MKANEILKGKFRELGVEEIGVDMKKRGPYEPGSKKITL